MMADPSNFFLPLYRIDEGKSGDKTKAWHISGMVFALGMCGELRNEIYINTRNYIATLKKRFNISSPLTVLRGLSDYGFYFNEEETSFSVDYPDNKNILNIIMAFGRKMSFFNTYMDNYPMHCLSSRCFEYIGDYIPDKDLYDYKTKTVFGKEEKNIKKKSTKTMYAPIESKEVKIKMDMQNRTVFITGGASGIGRASAITFAKAGANVFLVDINDTGSDAVVTEIDSFGGNAFAYMADVTKENEVSCAIERCVQKFGSIDFAHNNAAVIISTNTVNCTEEIWNKVIDTNLKGYWLCMKYELKQMLKQGYGNIVNTSSISGLIGRAGDMPYNVSKHGIIGLTKTAALENADKNIRINCVCPGAIHTWDGPVTKKLNGLHPMKRIGQPEEVANAVVWLCSDTSSFITGHSLVIDGGRIAGEW